MSTNLKSEKPASLLMRHQAIENLPLAAWIIDSATLKIYSLNKSAVELLGYTEEESATLLFTQVFNSEEGAKLIRQLNSKPAQGKMQLEALMKNGDVVTVQISYNRIIENGVSLLQVIATDISSFVRDRENLLEEKERYQAYIKQSFEGIYCQEFKVPVNINLPALEMIEEVRKCSYISDCNLSMAKMYGLDRVEDIIGTPIETLLDFNDPGNIDYLLSFIANGYRIENAESKEIDKHGQVKYFLNNVIGIIENGQLKRIWGTQKDITLQKNHERQSKLLTQLVQETSDVLTASDLDYKPITWNKAAEKIYGLKAEQVIGKYLSDFIKINYGGLSREEVRKVISRDGEWRGEASFIRPSDNTEVFLLMGFKLMKDEGEAHIGYLITATDITERKLTESKLRESENRFREMADSSPVMIWMSDNKNQLEYLNSKWVSFTGKDLTGNAGGWGELIHPEDFKSAKEIFDIGFAERRPVTITYRLRTVDGSYRWVQDVSVARVLNDGEFIGYIGSVVDIEDQKQKEFQLLYQATILENVSDVLVTTDLDFNVRSWNRMAEEAYEIREADAIGKTMGGLVQFQYPQTNRQFALNELMTRGIWKGEVSIIKKDGEVKHFLHTVKKIRDEKGNSVGYLSAGRDITEKKIADQQVEQSEQFYRSLIADSLDGMILVNEKGLVTFCAPSIRHVLGFEVDEVEGHNAFEFVHADDITFAFESFEREREERPEHHFIIVRLKKKSGEWIWCMVRGHNLLANPYVRSIVIYFHDDTLRRKASEALKESERRFRNLIRDIHVGVLIVDREGQVTLCNKSFTDIFEIEESEIVGKPIHQIASFAIHEDHRPFEPEEMPLYRSLTNKERVEDLVLGVKREQLGIVWVIINSDPVLDEQGELIHVVCSVKDITERKRMEEESLSRTISHQRQLTQATIDGQENERREVGKELHDNIGQQLTTIKLFLDMAKSTADDTTAEMVNMGLKGVSDVINDIRAMSRSLIPSTLNDLGLEESINELIDGFRRTQLLTIELDCENFCEEGMAENQQLTIFRIVQEQLNNIMKHAEARSVRISLRTTATANYLQVLDDGKGFDARKIKKGLGFVNIRNRAELFGGTSEVISSPGKGCRLEVMLPTSDIAPTE